MGVTPWSVSTGVVRPLPLVTPFVSEFSPVDYRILAMLHVDKPRQRLFDRQAVTDQAVDRWWFRLRAGVKAGAARGPCPQSPIEWIF